MEKLGENLKRWRTFRNMTQEELAKGIMSREMVSKIENGEGSTSKQVITMFAKRLNLPYEKLVKGSRFEVKSDVEGILRPLG